MRNLYGQNWFTPMEIVKQGLIVNSRGANSTINGNYNYVLELIKSGRLKAKNYSVGKKRANYMVPESEIVRYHESVTKIVPTKGKVNKDHGIHQNQAGK